MAILIFICLFYFIEPSGLIFLQYVTMCHILLKKVVTLFEWAKAPGGISSYVLEVGSLPKSPLPVTVAWC